MKASYPTLLGAKRNAPNRAHSPCVAKLQNGRYEAFPLGHPLPVGAVIVSRNTLGKWFDADELQAECQALGYDNGWN